MGHSDKEMTEYYDHNKMDMAGLKNISFNEFNTKRELYNAKSD